MSKRTLIAVTLTATTSLVALAQAQQPRITNGAVTTQPASAPFTASFRTLVNSRADVFWIGYSVPAVEGERSMCGDGNITVVNGTTMSGSGCCSSGRLEPDADRSQPRTTVSGQPGPVKLEGDDRISVLIRVADRSVERIRIVPASCALDAGGRPVVWIDSVGPADSVALLESYAVPNAAGSRRLLGGAITAIALHGDPSADAALDRLVAPAQPEAVRREVPFWLGNARGQHGLDTLRRVLRDDPSADVKKKAVFGVSQSRQPGAFDMLAGVARSDQQASIRGEALFWLAQRGDARAPAVIAEALEKDSSPEVRKRAVFALSQLKDDAGVSALVTVARTHADPAVRSEAIFWLGQKAGAKAAATIAERVEQDPETEVKKKAVFALSQLPKDEGVPLLINVARTQKSPEVRKQAMFWLGQSKDPRAIEFFAEVLAAK